MNPANRDCVQVMLTQAGRDGAYFVINTLWIWEKQPSTRVASIFAGYTIGGVAGKVQHYYGNKGILRLILTSSQELLSFQEPILPSPSKINAMTSWHMSS